VFLLDASQNAIKSWGSFLDLFWCIFALLQLAFPDDSGVVRIAPDNGVNI